MKTKHLTQEDVRRLVMQKYEKAGSFRSLAREWGLSAAYLCDFLNGRRGPGSRILNQFGLKRFVNVTYVRKTDIDS